VIFANGGCLVGYESNRSTSFAHYIIEDKLNYLVRSKALWRAADGVWKFDAKLAKISNDNSGPSAMFGWPYRPATRRDVTDDVEYFDGAEDFDL